MTRGLLLVLLILLAPSGTPAFAAAEKNPSVPNEPNADLRLDVSGIGLPILRNGQVVNFVFVRARILLNPGLPRPEVDARDPFIREALIRSAYRAPLNAPNDFMAVDPKIFEAVLLREAKAVLGANIARSAHLRDQRPQKIVYAPRKSESSTPPIQP